MTDLAPLSQALTIDGSCIHECIGISWKYNKWLMIQKRYRLSFLVLLQLGSCVYNLILKLCFTFMLHVWTPCGLSHHFSGCKQQSSNTFGVQDQGSWRREESSYDHEPGAGSNDANCCLHTSSVQYIKCTVLLDHIIFGMPEDHLNVNCQPAVEHMAWVLKLFCE